MNKFLKWTTQIFNRPEWVIAITVIISVLLGIAVSDVSFDNSAKAMLPKNNKDVDINDYYTSADRFGSSDYLIIAFDSAKGMTAQTLQLVNTVERQIKERGAHHPVEVLSSIGGLTPEQADQTLGKIRDMGATRDTYPDVLIPKIRDGSQWREWGLSESQAKRLSAWAKKESPKTVWEALQNPISKTQSILSAELIENANGELVSHKIFEGETVRDADVESILRRATAWPLFEDLILSKDRTTAALMVKLSVIGAAATDGTVDFIDQVLKANEVPGIKVFFTGEYRFNQKMGEYMQQDLGILLPLVTLLLALVLFLIFRRWQAVAMSLAVVSVGVVTALGLMGWLGVQLTIVGVATPVLLVAIACAYSVHQLSHFYLDPLADKKQILVQNMGTVGLALVLSGIATSIGFGALVVDDFVPMRNFGLFTAIGNLFALGAVLYFLPALLLVGKKPKPVMEENVTRGWISRLLLWLVTLNRKKPGTVVVTSIALSLVLAVGLPMIVSELNPLGFFKKDSPVAVATKRVNDKLGGNQTLNLVLDSDLRSIDGRSSGIESPVDILTPEVLHKLDSVSVAVREKYPRLVGKVISFVDLIKKMNQEMHDGDPAYYVIPENQNLIAQYLLLFSGEIDDYVTSGHDKLNLTISLKNPATSESESIRAFLLESFSREWLDTNRVQINVTGTAHLYAVSNELLVEGTMLSIVICLVIVLVLLFFVLRSFWLSLIAATPIFFTLLMNYGIMGWFNLPLDAGTSLVASVAIGIGVDFTIHFITWYRYELAKDGDVCRALEDSIVHKGRAIIYNMLTILAGFVVLAFSRFVPLVNFGLLVALSMVTTAIGSLVLVPAILRLLHGNKSRGNEAR